MTISGREGNVMAMSREDVIWAYKIFLGREPESEETIASQLANGQSRLELIMQIMESEEFAAKHVVQ
jgi:hypothetical protein